METSPTPTVCLDANKKVIKIGSSGRFSEKGREESLLAFSAPEIIKEYPGLRFKITSIKTSEAHTPVIYVTCLNLEKYPDLELMLNPEDIVIE